MNWKTGKAIPKEKVFVLCGTNVSPLVRIIEYDGVHPKPTTNETFTLTPPKGTMLTSGGGGDLPVLETYLVFSL